VASGGAAAANGHRPPLTPRQQLALTLICRSVTDRGYPPTVRELGAELGMTSSTSVLFVLRRLQAKGYLDRDPGVGPRHPGAAVTGGARCGSPTRAGCGQPARWAWIEDRRDPRQLRRILLEPGPDPAGPTRADRPVRRRPAGPGAAPRRTRPGGRQAVDATRGDLPGRAAAGAAAADRAAPAGDAAVSARRAAAARKRARDTAAAVVTDVLAQCERDTEEPAQEAP